MLLSRVNPSVTVPGLITPQVQDVDFDAYIGHKSNLGSRASEMLYFMQASNINSETTIGQQWNQELTKQTYSLGQVSMPYYRIGAYVEYNEDEKAKFESLVPGVSLPTFLEDIAKQGINQRRHQAILFGFDDSLNQGILANAQTQTLPADADAHDSLVTYNIPELQVFLAKIARDVMDASYGMAKPVVIASSIRVINYLKTALVPVGTYLESGSVDSVAGVYDKVVSEWLGVGSVNFIADDLLKGEDNDKLVFLAPGLTDQINTVSDDKSQNIVGKQSQITYNTTYDVAEGLLRFTRPSDFGINSSYLSFKMTPGVTLRSEAVSVIEVKYQ